MSAVDEPAGCCSANVGTKASPREPAHGSQCLPSFAYTKMTLSAGVCVAVMLAAVVATATDRKKARSEAA